MAGRGRGRGRGALNFDAITKTVGVPSPEQKDGSLSQLTEMIDVLDINAPSVNAVTQCALKTIKDGDATEKVLDALISRCQKDWRFAKQAAIISRDLVGDEENGKKFRAQLLRTMQSNFKQKDSLHDESVSQFLGAMSFMCQTFAMLRSDSGDPFSPLIVPVVDVLQLMTEDNATDQEMQCGVCQIRAIIPTLYMCDPSHLDKYHTLLSTLRSDVISCRGSRDLREAMLCAVEDNVRHAALHAARHKADKKQIV